MSRERIYTEFLKLHAPSKCNIFLGGFLFDMSGAESRQLDVIITTDTTPRYNFHNRDGSGKSFSPVEGTLGVVSIKSTLNKAEMIDALSGIASIPPTESLEGRLSIGIELLNYDEWPYKIVYASNGISGETLLQHLHDYYAENPSVPITRRPNLIHVAGKYIILRAVPGVVVTSGVTDEEPRELPMGTFKLITKHPDIQGILWVLNSLQQYAQASNEIEFSYGELINKVIQASAP
ncbi:hypothetical protein B9G53_10275 [Pseudanabaena sp. SR411]|uniref:DUF6602 domain-containing protein n=1 Tax=Pseudanabaena sp. SR411 TaxID=1980935 RepID=UPI000B996FF2|nr:DUF6602 domain-containing protein [Pseudanabaena sp. SR411]OYQ64696.1 hypothetical protein B9G53_10275 [Pseudanabaena sp. SR411]